jgi:hypothetical protein
MDKAYDLKALGEKLKEKGMPEVEELAEKAYEALKEWIIESAELSANPFDNMVPGFFGALDSIVKPKLDKIDNKEG